MNLNDIFDPSIPSPCYVIEEKKLLHNLEILRSVKERTGCKILLALKAFSMFSTFPLIRKYLDGVTASSLNEARLGFEEFGKEVHACAPAYRTDEFSEIMKYADHITFNSFSQWEHYKDTVCSENKNISYALRINPEYSSSPSPLYDPAGPRSRLGITIDNFRGHDLAGISGLHFHTLCEQNAEPLQKTLQAVEEKFGPYLKNMSWLNFGGGHHISRQDYDLDLLCELIIRFRDTYELEIILEPGEAVVYQAGVLVASVLDIVHNEIDIAILDTSAATHMPDVLEMPYRPDIIGSGKSGDFPHTYRLGGNTCLAGDIIGDYSFKQPLRPGSRLVFTDMALYTMVKNNTFNGVNLPAIGILKTNGSFELVKQFGYEDFKRRL